MPISCLFARGGGRGCPRKDYSGMTCTLRHLIAPPVASLVFAGLAPGDHAVSVCHDQNNNGRLDTNPIGVPSEPLGFSRNATGMMGPPKFADAAIGIDAADVAIRINLR